MTFTPNAIHEDSLCKVHGANDANGIAFRVRMSTESAWPDDWQARVRGYLTKEWHGLPRVGEMIDIPAHVLIAHYRQPTA